MLVSVYMSVCASQRVGFSVSVCPCPCFPDYPRCFRFHLPFDCDEGLSLETLVPCSFIFGTFNCFLSTVFEKRALCYILGVVTKEASTKEWFREIYKHVTDIVNTNSYSEVDLSKLFCNLFHQSQARKSVL